MTFLVLFYSRLKVAFRSLLRALNSQLVSTSTVAKVEESTRDKESYEDHGFSQELDGPKDEEERDVVHHSSRKRQPTTDIFFHEQRIAETGVSAELDDVVIRTDWKPYLTENEKVRLDVFGLTSDLKHVAKNFRRFLARLRDRCTGRLDLSDELARDKFSLPGRKFQTAIRSKIAGASMRGVPEDAACYVTIDIAATPPLPVWLHAGGSHPRMLMADFNRKLHQVLDEVGCKHVYREGFLEVAKAPRIMLSNRYQGLFVKSYSKSSWPAKLHLKNHIDEISVVHVHAVMVLLDADGQPISLSTFQDALRRRFPASRAVMVTELGTTARTASKTLPEAAEAAIRYAMLHRKNRTPDEMREQGRWNNKLKPEDLWASGWTSFVNVRPWAVPILRSSLLARNKLREALVDIEIGNGWTVFEPPVKIVKEYQDALVTVLKFPQNHPHAANDNYSDTGAETRRARDGPVTRAAW